MDYMIKDHNKWVNGSLTPSMLGFKKPNSSSVNDTAKRKMADTFFTACFFSPKRCIEFERLPDLDEIR